MRLRALEENVAFLHCILAPLPVLIMDILKTRLGGSKLLLRQHKEFFSQPRLGQSQDGNGSENIPPGGLLLISWIEQDNHGVKSHGVNTIVIKNCHHPIATGCNLALANRFERKCYGHRFNLHKFVYHYNRKNYLMGN